jgi:hypothetical protein
VCPQGQPDLTANPAAAGTPSSSSALEILKNSIILTILQFTHVKNVEISDLAESKFDDMH